MHPDFCPFLRLLYLLKIIILQYVKNIIRRYNKDLNFKHPICSNTLCLVSEQDAVCIVTLVYDLFYENISFKKRNNTTTLLFSFESMMFGMIGHSSYCADLLNLQPTCTTQSLQSRCSYQGCSQVVLINMH